MKESGLKRTLRYFVRMAQEYVLYTAGLSAAMSVYMWLINGFISFAEMAASIPINLIYISGLMLFINGRAAGLQFYSMLISFGCRRKNVFWGSLVMDAFYVTECLAIYEISIRIFNPDDKNISTLLILVFYLVIEGIANLAGLAMMKWGKIANVLTVVVVMMLSMGLGVWFAAGPSDSMGLLTNLISGNISPYWLGAAVLGAAAVCAASNAAGWHVLKSYEVRA